ncbi:hypothetical protein NDU88_001597 [Pleurodeles waltl]|uniref:Uncharacterized protein n=1 Tax=Pleurodeles waltl TaxID=8319 RepID=A0AAV7R8G4_PLEWA|nr:hypothetical protein NDU88_001597 [Pleurodeles waltl]
MKPLEEPRSSLQDGKALHSVDEKERGVPQSSGQGMEAEGNANDDDKEWWFEEWWMPPVNAPVTATIQESCG